MPIQSFYERLNSLFEGWLMNIRDAVGLTIFLDQGRDGGVMDIGHVGE